MLAVDLVLGQVDDQMSVLADDGIPAWVWPAGMPVVTIHLECDPASVVGDDQEVNVDSPVGGILDLVFAVAGLQVRDVGEQAGNLLFEAAGMVAAVGGECSFSAEAAVLASESRAALCGGWRSGDRPARDFYRCRLFAGCARGRIVDRQR